MTPIISAHGLTKRYGRTLAVDHIDLEIPPGRIVGLIGPNGAGKTSALKAILGLATYDGELSVLGKNPATQRAALMEDVCFIADVAVLPRWLRVSQALELAEGLHPRFDRARAEAFLERTTIRRESRVRELSKGMVTQLHLALVMAIDARLLVLDEPTLGLDILYRKEFYGSLLNDYFDEDRTILVTTHQVEEIEHILTDVLFIDRGRIVDDLVPAAPHGLVEDPRGAELGQRGDARGQDRDLHFWPTRIAFTATIFLDQFGLALDSNRHRFNLLKSKC